MNGCILSTWTRLENHGRVSLILRLSFLSLPALPYLEANRKVGRGTRLSQNMVEYDRAASHYILMELTFYSPRVALCIVLLCQEPTKPSLSLLLFCCGRFCCLWSSDIKESWRTKPSCSLSSGTCRQFLSAMCLLQPVQWTRSQTNKQTNKQTKKQTNKNHKLTNKQTNSRPIHLSWRWTWGF